MAKFKSGKTPLVKINELCVKYNLANLLLKDESKNPFGTWKDRRSEMIVKKAKQEFVNKLCLITSGNAGLSLAKFANKSHIKIVSVIDVNLPPAIKQALKDVCTKIIETNLSEKILTPKEVIALARENDKEVIWDATNGFHEAYESIIKELKNDKIYQKIYGDVVIYDIPYWYPKKYQKYITNDLVISTPPEISYNYIKNITGECEYMKIFINHKHNRNYIFLGNLIKKTGITSAILFTK